MSYPAWNLHQQTEARGLLAQYLRADIEGTCQRHHTPAGRDGWWDVRPLICHKEVSAEVADLNSANLACATRLGLLVPHGSVHYLYRIAD